MARGRKRHRLRDKWRTKKWLIVKAPSSFGGDSVAYIPATDEVKALGRVIETTLFDILKQDPQHYSIKLYFQIESVEGDIAQTIFKGHEYSREYLRSLVRRGLSSIRLIKNYTTRDQAVVQVQIAVFTQGRINTSKKHAIRSVVDTVLTRKATDLTYNQFVQEAVLGKIASDVYNSAKKVARLRHVGVSKTKLIKKSTIDVEDTSVLQPEPEETVPEESEEVELPTAPASTS
ncbi:MAG: 30S ribosomal protein S3ae [Nitrososphaerales archaeon]